MLLCCLLIINQIVCLFAGGQGVVVLWLEHDCCLLRGHPHRPLSDSRPSRRVQKGPPCTAHLHLLWSRLLFHDLRDSLPLLHHVDATATGLLSSHWAYQLGSSFVFAFACDYSALGLILRVIVVQSFVIGSAPFVVIASCSLCKLCDFYFLFPSHSECIPLRVRER